MTAPSPQSQPTKAELLVELRRHETEYQELVHGPLCGQAADRIEELEAQTSLVTFNEACKRIETLEAAIQDLLAHAQIMMMEGCDCETCAPVARARALVPLSSDLARSPTNPEGKIDGH